jgi:uncharacterized protein YjbJ (UPF0337 family)
MGAKDKAKNTAEKAVGKIKEEAAKTTGNESAEAEGKAHQAAGDLKNAGEQVKDAFKKGRRCRSAA